MTVTGPATVAGATASITCGGVWGSAFRARGFVVKVQVAEFGAHS